MINPRGTAGPDAKSGPAAWLCTPGRNSGGDGRPEPLHDHPERDRAQGVVAEEVARPTELVELLEGEPLDGTDDPLVGVGGRVGEPGRVDHGPHVGRLVRGGAGVVVAPPEEAELHDGAADDASLGLGLPERRVAGRHVLRGGEASGELPGDAAERVEPQLRPGGRPGVLVAGDRTLDAAETDATVRVDEQRERAALLGPEDLDPASGPCLGRDDVDGDDLDAGAVAFTALGDVATVRVEAEPRVGLAGVRCDADHWDVQSGLQA